MPDTRSLRILDAATSFAADVCRIMDSARPRLIEAAQFRSAACSIGANIAEAYGRAPGADRLRFFHIARGSAEESLQHLRLNYRSGRVRQALFFSLSNRGVIRT